MKSDISRFHGYDERISKANFVQVVEFYYRIMKNADILVSEKGSNNDEGSGSGDYYESSGMDLSESSLDDYLMYE